MTRNSKDDLFQRGLHLLQLFCKRNRLSVPRVTTVLLSDWHFGACAYYRPVYIKICVPLCASVGLWGRSWSFPGYAVDRTPYGVLQHELGHHVDAQRSGLTKGYVGTHSKSIRTATREEALTSYCPNDGEWFAEMIRLFITNPDLLRQIRPHTYAALLDDGLKPVVHGSWDKVLEEAPERTRQAAQNKIRRAS